MAKLLALALALMLAVCAPAAAHEISFSHVDLRLQPSRTEVTVQIPIVALVQEVPTSLPPGVAEPELRARPLSPQARAVLGRLVVARLKLASAGKPLPLTITDVTPAAKDIAVTATAPADAGPLEVEANLFPTDPVHKVFVNVYRGAELAGQYALDRQDFRFTLESAERPLNEVIATFVRQGVHHIFIGPDHILFVLALVLLGGRLWSQVKIITAFTVAHSLTLTLATLQIVLLPSRLVESLIALSIVVVGLHDIRQLRRGETAVAGRDPRVLFAFFFGLVHGFGFASVLQELALPRNALAWSLAAFNIGVEIGQVTIVLSAAPLLLALRRYAPGWVSKGVLTVAAIVVVLVGAYWFFQRALGG